jgi:hypothetical protein
MSIPLSTDLQIIEERINNSNRRRIHWLRPVKNSIEYVMAIEKTCHSRIDAHPYYQYLMRFWNNPANLAFNRIFKMFCQALHFENRLIGSLAGLMRFDKGKKIKGIPFFDKFH